MEQAKAWIFTSPGRKLELQKIDLPELGTGEVLVKNICSTICKSDLITYLGKRPGPTPSILGHEILGEVVECGSHLTDYWGNTLKKGDLITWSLMAFCGECRNCKNGIPQKCSSLKKYGHEKMEGHFKLTGGFASHTHLFPGTSIYKLSNELPKNLLAGINCSWSTIAAAMRLAGNVKGKNVLVTGAGMLGILTIMMCRENGAKNILAIDKNNVRLDLAQKFGANYLIPVSPKNGVSYEIINDFLKEDCIDVIFEMTGVNKLLQLGLDVAGTGGTIILAGSVFPTDDIKINPERVVRSLLQIKGIHNYVPEDLANAIRYMENSYEKYPLNDLFDERVFGIENIDEALEHSLLSPKHRVVIELV